MKVREAIKRAIKAGKFKTQNEIGRALYPDKEKGFQNSKMSNLVRGVRRVYYEDEIKELCRLLDVDANYLFGIESRLPKWHNIADELPTEDGLYYGTNGDKVLRLVFNSNRQKFYFYHDGGNLTEGWEWWMEDGWLKPK